MTLTVFITKNIYGQEVAKPVDLETAKVFHDRGVRSITMKTLLALEQEGYKVDRVLSDGFSLEVNASRLFDQLR